jgi:hypothetical protein
MKSNDLKKLGAIYENTLMGGMMTLKDADVPPEAEYAAGDGEGPVMHPDPQAAVNEQVIAQLKAIEQHYSRCSSELSDDMRDDLHVEISHIVETNPEANWATVITQLEQEEACAIGDDAYIEAIKNIHTTRDPDTGEWVSSL